MLPSSIAVLPHEEDVSLLSIGIQLQMGVCTSEQPLEMIGSVLLVLQRFGGFKSAWELLPVLLLLAEVHIAVAAVGKMMTSTCL